MTCEELLTLPREERFKWLRSADGPLGKVSHDRLAAALETSRQTVISWEHGTEPRRLVDRLVELTGCPPEVWLRDEAGQSSESQTLVLLRELRDVVEVEGQREAQALASLAKEVRALRRQLEARAPQAKEVGDG